MPELSIREATADDISALLSLYGEAGIGDEMSFTVEEATEQLAMLGRYPYFRVFVALIGDAVVGTYELVLLDNMAKRGKKAGVVEAVAVHPAHQGSGIGRAMMQHAMGECRRAECYKLTLSSNLKRVEAHRFYDSLGFTRHGYSFQVEL